VAEEPMRSSRDQQTCTRGGIGTVGMHGTTPTHRQGWCAISAAAYLTALRFTSSPRKAGFVLET
jgi:hypothetical protein